MSATNEKTKLFILWTNDNIVTAELMVFIYGINAKRRDFWEDPLTKILKGDEKLLTI